MTAAQDIEAQARQLIQTCVAHSIVIATAESCTGGMIAAALTDIAGSSAAFDRGFVTYSNEAKADMLGVPMDTIVKHGAVSRPVATAMADGALTHSAANLSVAVTGIAGPGGGTDIKPVGLVYIAIKRAGAETVVHECKFADEGHDTRKDVREATVKRALEMLLSAI